MLSSWLTSCAVFYLKSRSWCLCSFPLWRVVQDVKIDYICSWSFFFDLLCLPHDPMCSLFTSFQFHFNLICLRTYLIGLIALLSLNTDTSCSSYVVNYSHGYVTFWYVWNIHTTNFEILIGTSFFHKYLILDVWRIHTSLSHFERIFHMCDKYVRILHTCGRFVRKFFDRPEYGLVLAQLDIEALTGKFHSNPHSSFWGDAITRKIKDGRRRPCFSTDRIFLVLAQLDIEGNILTKISNNPTSVLGGDAIKSMSMRNFSKSEPVT